MAAASPSHSSAPDDDTLATPVGGNALNPGGDATHNPDRLGAGETSAGEGDALDSEEIDEIDERAKDITE